MVGFATNNNLLYVWNDHVNYKDGKRIHLFAEHNTSRLSITPYQLIRTTKDESNKVEHTIKITVVHFAQHPIVIVRSKQ